MKKFLEINFDKKNTELKLLISKKSFEDTSEKITKELLKKIAKISEKEYGVAFKDCYSKLLKGVLPNSVMLAKIGALILFLKSW